jgi:hypothetical protein
MASSNQIRIDPTEWERAIQRIVEADPSDWQEFFGAQLDLTYMIRPVDGTIKAVPDSSLKPEVVAFCDAVHMSVMMGNGVIGLLDSSCDGLSILLRAIRSFRLINACDHLASIEPYADKLRQLGVNMDQPIPDDFNEGIELFPFDQWDQLYGINESVDFDDLEHRPLNSIHNILQRYVIEHRGAFSTPML